MDTASAFEKLYADARRAALLPKGEFIPAWTALTERFDRLLHVWPVDPALCQLFDDARRVAHLHLPAAELERAWAGLVDRLDLLDGFRASGWVRSPSRYEAVLWYLAHLALPA